MGNATAQGNAGEIVNQFHHRIKHLATHVFEIDIDAVRARRLELGFKVVVLVVHTGIKPIDIHHVLAFIRRTGHAHHTATLELGDLTDHLTDRAAGGRHDNRLAFFRLADFQQPGIGGKTGHAQHTHGGADRRLFRIQLAQHLLALHRVFLPATKAEHVIAGFIAIQARFHHLANGSALHHITQLHTGGVGLGRAHAATHVGVQGQVNGLDQNLSVLRRRHLPFTHGQMLSLRHTLGVLGQNDLAVNCHGALPDIGTVGAALEPRICLRKAKPVTSHEKRVAKIQADLPGFAFRNSLLVTRNWVIRGSYPRGTESAAPTAK